MALTSIATAVRNAACNARVDLIDVGSSDAQGDLVGGTAALAATLWTSNLSNPAFGAAAVGVATASAITEATATGTGTAAMGKFQDRDNTELWRFSIGTSGENLNLNTVSIVTGDKVNISAATITEPAS